MDISEAVIRTVCYFDIFDHPLTRAEIRRWLCSSCSQEPNSKNQIPKISVLDTDAVILQLITGGLLKEENGLVSVADRVGLYAIRAGRYRHSCRKWKRARRWARVFAALPGVELVGVGNTLAFNNAKDGSDIDLFIVVAPGTIWRARFLCTALSAIFGLRPRPGDNRDKLCLSFFVTTNALDISKFARHDEVDVYLHYWIRSMVPLAGSENALREFIAANPASNARGVLHAPSGIKRIFAVLKYLPGDLFMEWQNKRFPREVGDALGRGDSSVVVSDDVLKFHVNDRRTEIYQKWKDRVDLILS